MENALIILGIVVYLVGAGAIRTYLIKKLDDEYDDTDVLATLLCPLWPIIICFIIGGLITKKIMGTSA